MGRCFHLLLARGKNDAVTFSEALIQAPFAAGQCSQQVFAGERPRDT